jgi:hypothetical protein
MAARWCQQSWLNFDVRAPVTPTYVGVATPTMDFQWSAAYLDCSHWTSCQVTLGTATVTRRRPSVAPNNDATAHVWPHQKRLRLTLGASVHIDTYLCLLADITIA